MSDSADERAYYVELDDPTLARAYAGVVMASDDQAAISAFVRLALSGDDSGHTNAMRDEEGDGFPSATAVRTTARYGIAWQVDLDASDTHAAIYIPQAIVEPSRWHGLEHGSSFGPRVMVRERG